MVGLGSIGQRHMRNLRALLGEEVSFFAYRVRKLNDLLADNLDIIQGKKLEDEYDLKIYDNLDQALSTRPDVVFVTNPTSEHIEVAISAAKAGCDIFIEKPLSHSMDKVHELQQIVRERHLICCVGFQNRFHPAIQMVHKLISERSIGNILAVNAEVGDYLPNWHVYEDYRISYAARRDMGGGVVLTQIHELDYLYWFFGLPRRVFAMGGKLSNLEIDVEDIASMMLEFPIDGRLVPVHLHADYIQRPTSRGLKVIGDKGKIIVDIVENTLLLYSEKGELVEKSLFDNFNRNDMFINELKSFLESVRNRTEPFVTVEDGIASLKIAIAVKQSITDGHPINLI